MSIKKIAELSGEKACSHPEHKFPIMWYPSEAGVYVNICPACGHEEKVTHDPLTM